MKQHIFKRYFEFDGKRYEVHLIRHSRAAAEKIAESLRKRGFLARVSAYANIESVRLFAIYKRKA